MTSSSFLLGSPELWSADTWTFSGTLIQYSRKFEYLRTFNVHHMHTEIGGQPLNFIIPELNFNVGHWFGRSIWFATLTDWQLTTESPTPGIRKPTSSLRAPITINTSPVGPIFWALGRTPRRLGDQQHWKRNFHKIRSRRGNRSSSTVTENFCSDLTPKVQGANSTSNLQRYEAAVARMHRTL